MMEYPKLQEALADFKKMQQAHSLPPLMEIKLQCLQQGLLGQEPTESLSEQLPVYERLSLQQMSKDTQTNLFISIVRCLCGREIITYFSNERAYLKNESSFFAWAKCYITCDSNALFLKKKRDSVVNWYRLQVDKIWISKGYKYYKKKSVFGLYYENKKYVLGFDEEITCERIHRILQQLLREKRQFQVVKYDTLQFQKEEDESYGLNGSRVKGMIKEQQQQFLEMLQHKVDQYALADDEEFKLIKNIDQGRVLESKNGSIKVNLIIENINVMTLVQCFTQFNQWNTNLQVFTILNRPRNNSYLAYFKTVKYSFISYPRDGYLSITYYKACKCRGGRNSNSYLLIDSIQNDGEENSGAVRMNYKQIVQFSIGKDDKKLVLITILTEADFKGYSKQNDNVNMTLHLLTDLNNFPKYCKEQILGQNKSPLFNDALCDCNTNKRKGERKYSDSRSDVSLPTQRNQDNFSQSYNSQIFSSKQRIALFDDSSQKQIIKIISDVQNNIQNESILDLLKQNKHCSYALHHHFTDKQEAICTYTGNNKQFLIQGNRWRFDDDQYIFCDSEALAAQKDILKMIIKQLSTNLLAGKSIMSMSLPVEIFDKKSMLDVIASSLGFVPHFMAKASQTSDPIQQIKYITAAFMFVSATSPNIQKPFNPILGETFQGLIGDISVTLQQISHHPPISSLLIKTKQYQIYGNFDVVVDMGLNSAYSKLTNWINVNIFTTSTFYLVKMPDVELGGLMYGNRTLKVVNRGYVYQKNNKLFCQYSIGKEKKRVYQTKQKVRSSDVTGGIFKVRAEFGNKVEHLDKKKTFQGLKADDITQTYCFLSGKWYGNLLFDDKVYKSIIDGPYPDKVFRQQYLLPSDSLFRQDVIFKKWKDNARSNQQKERLQNMQRCDRKLRQKFKSK